MSAPTETLGIGLQILKDHPTWFLFPIRPLSKKPPLFRNELELASDQPLQIAKWHKAFFGCNWGVALKKSKLVVPDVDTKPGKVGLDTLAYLGLMYGPFPNTFTVRTPSGGLHYYFDEANGVTHQMRVSGFGQDIDSTNYVLAPGCWLSGRDTGDIAGPYEIINNAPVAPTPAWFKDVLKRDERPVADQTPAENVEIDSPAIIERAIQFLTTDAKPSIQFQNGEFTLLMNAAILKDMGVSKYKTIELLNEYYNVRRGDGSRPFCEPQWLIGDGPVADRLDIKVENAWNYLVQVQPGSRAPEAEFTMLKGAEIDEADVDAMATIWEFVNPGNAPKPEITQTIVVDYDDFGLPITSAPPEVEQELDDFGVPIEPGKITLTEVPLVPTPNRKMCDLDQIDESRRPSGEQQYETLCNRWVWITGIKRFVNRLDPHKQWDTIQFDSEYNYLVDTSSVSKYLFKDKKRLLRKFHHIAFRPGKPEVFGFEYNVWRPSEIEPKAGDTRLWNEHINRLFQNPEDRDAVLNWMAWILQNPNAKPNHALLIVGRATGTGKSFVARVLERIIGEANTQRPKNSSMGGDFNSWLLNCRLCILEEVFQVGRRENVNAMRDVISEPRVEVNKKGIPAFVIPNYACILGVTNHTDALPLDESDRRWLIVETFAQPEDPAVYDKLFTALPSDTGAPPLDPDLVPAVYAELLARNVGNYTGFKRPIVTAAKQQMIELSRTDAESWLHESRGNQPLCRRVLTIQDVRDAMPNEIQRTQRLNSSVIPTFLRDKLGATRTKEYYRLSNGQRARLWITPGPKIPDSMLVAQCERERKTDAKVADDTAVDDFGQ